MNSLTTADAGSVIDTFKSDLAPLLRENGQSFDRLKSVFTIAVLQEPKILECTAESLRREISKCAADGLVPDSKEAVLLPYWDPREKVYLANYQPMVQGIIKRVKELGGVFSIVCKLVHENDEFVLNEADPDSLVHKSDPFAKPEQRGEVVGGYAVFRDEQKRVMHLETMSLEDFVKVRQASKAPDSPAWKKWTNEMYRKAVLRRGSKYVPINNDKIRTLLERQDDMFEFHEARATERANPFTGEIIDAEAHPSTSQREERDKTKIAKDRASQNENTLDGRAESKTAADNKRDTKAAEKPEGPPSIPDVDVKPADKEKAVECAEKILGIALDQNLDPPGRRGALKVAASMWKEAMPEYLHDLVKACISMSDWAIQRDASEAGWAAEHAMFVHHLKSLLEVEKLNVGKYP